MESILEILFFSIDERLFFLYFLSILSILKNSLFLHFLSILSILKNSLSSILKNSISNIDFGREKRFNLKMVELESILIELFKTM